MRRRATRCNTILKTPMTLHLPHPPLPLGKGCVRNTWSFSVGQTSWPVRLEFEISAEQVSIALACCASLAVPDESVALAGQAIARTPGLSVFRNASCPDTGDGQNR